MIKKWSVSYPAVNGTEQRRAYVYLPTMYEAEPDRRFPVLYMFDGQNVFFDEDATYGKSWGVADYLDYTDTPLIVAAVYAYNVLTNRQLVCRIPDSENFETGLGLQYRNYRSKVRPAEKNGHRNGGTACPGRNQCTRFQRIEHEHVLSRARTP